MNDVGNTVFIAVNRYRHGRRSSNLGVPVVKWWAYFAPSTPLVGIGLTGDLVPPSSLK